MSWIKSLPYYRHIGIVLALELAIASGINSPALPQSFSMMRVRQMQVKQTQVKQMQIAQSNPPPPPTNPGSSSAGGRRDSSACPQDPTVTTSPLLTALSPIAAPGLTLEEHPTFLVYVPGTSAKSAEFSLRDHEGRGVYRAMVALTRTPNLISVSLPAQTAALEVGKPYTWAFAIICNPDDRLEDRFVTGSVQRAALDATRLRQIGQASPGQRLALYQEDGVWYETLALLLELNHSQPNDPDLSTAWRELLQSGGVDTLIEINSDKQK